MVFLYFNLFGICLFLIDLVQSDEIKGEIMKQNGLPPILKYAKETTDDPLPLEITYAMTFNSEAKKLISEDREFVECMKELRNSEKKKSFKNGTWNTLETRR